MLKLLLKLAGKEGMQIDEAVGVSYILRLCRKYGVMLFRGATTSICYRKISFPIFVGSKTTLISKKQMSIGKKSKIHNGVKIDALSREGVFMGNSCVIGENSVIECTGNIRNLGKGLRIGHRTSFGRNCFFGAAGGISIGDDVIAGEYVRFHSENHNFQDLTKLIKDQGVNHKGILIGNNCWIGAGSVFLDGAVLGNGCVVAANAVVRGVFGDNCVIGGVPAKVLKKRG